MFTFLKELILHFRDPYGFGTEPFTMPRNAWEHMDLLLRICSFQFCSELNIYCYSTDDDRHRAGQIDIFYQERNPEMNSLIRSGAPELYRFLYEDPGFYPEDAEKRMPAYRKFTFFEPDSKLFSVTRDELNRHLESRFSHFYIWNFWDISSPRRIRITCDDLAFQDRLDRCSAFLDYVKGKN